MVLQLLLRVVGRLPLAFKLQLVLPLKRVLAVFLLLELLLQPLDVFATIILRVLADDDFLVGFTLCSLEVVDVVL